MLFPDPRIGEGDNRIEPGQNASIPLAFDENPGKIRLFVLLRTDDFKVDNTPHDVAEVLSHAGHVSRAKGLKVDVDTSTPDTAIFAAMAASDTFRPRELATEIVLDHKRFRQPAKKP